MSNHKLQRDYESLIPTIQHLSMAAQFVSGATAAVGIYIVILEKMPFSLKLVAIGLTIILTTIIIGSFEGGIRKLFPYWIRQILNWLFDEELEHKKPRKIRVVLFLMLCIMLVPLILGTTLASWKASPDLVAYTTPPPPIKDLTMVADHLDGTLNSLLQQFNQDQARDSIHHNQRLAIERTQWESQISAQNAERKRYLKLYAEGHAWAKGVADKIKNKTIPGLKAQMQSELGALSTTYTLSQDSLRQLKQTALLHEQKNKTDILQSTQNYNRSALDRTQHSVEKWGGFLAVLAIIATFFTLFCLSFIEAYKAGVLPDGQGVTPPTGSRTRRRNTAYPNTQQHLEVQTVSRHNSYPNQRDNFVAQDTQPVSTSAVSPPTEHTTIQTQREINFVGIDNLIKRTRQQYKRSMDPSKSLESRTTNAEKARENITFLRSLGVKVEVDPEEEGKLMVVKREVG